MFTYLNRSKCGSEQVGGKMPTAASEAEKGACKVGKCIGRATVICARVHRISTQPTGVRELASPMTYETCSWVSLKGYIEEFRRSHLTFRRSLYLFTELILWPVPRFFTQRFCDGSGGLHLIEDCSLLNGFVQNGKIARRLA